MLVDMAVEKGVGTSKPGQLGSDFQPVPPGLPGLQPQEKRSLNISGQTAPKRTTSAQCSAAE